MYRKIVRMLLLAPFLMAFQCDEDGVESASVVTDIDGNTYNTIRIGNQVWMAENLKTTSLNDGTPIIQNNAPDNNEDWNSANPTFLWASTLDLNNDIDAELPFDYYGAIYNEAAVASGKLAPKGWRIPTKEDWMALKEFLTKEGHAGNEGTVLKSVTGWNPNSGNGTDLYGFNGLPNGYVDAFGAPKADAIIATWATSTKNSTEQFRMVINLLNNTMDINEQSTLVGSGIRCIKE